MRNPTLAGFIKAAQRGTNFKSTLTIVDSLLGSVTTTRDAPLIPPCGPAAAAGGGDAQLDEGEAMDVGEAMGEGEATGEGEAMGEVEAR